MQHFLSVRNLSANTIETILERAEVIGGTREQHTGRYFAANLFFEPSTRTKMSFVVAERNLGMDTLDFHTETSSTAKGESLYDTVRTYESIGADLLVIRHANDNWCDELGSSISVPIINAGSGKGEHPTQCMLDLYTIKQEFGAFQGLNVAIAGDIKHSRVARSHVSALKTVGANVYFVNVPGFMDESLDIPSLTMDEACTMCDVVMLLRIQHERHGNGACDTTSYLEKFGLTIERERKMQNHAIIMHPAPVNRNVEIDTRLVECDRSRIFQQMENGVAVRMGIMDYLLAERSVFV
ncbi:aspartate carbamoyltransferase catalytic subunit [Lentibacillus lipolyticus]|nr:aspartate carbamoyltransferase catalytic subunit [Lentibacillus lipolyticus]